MRYLAIGDIHGYADVLRRLLEMVRPKPDDEIITLGDYVDRGPDSRGVLDMMTELNRTRRLTALRGDYHRWGRFITHGHVPGDTAGNFVVETHLAAAVVIMSAGALQLVPQVRKRLSVVPGPPA